jgi:hypothetical protein
MLHMPCDERGAGALLHERGVQVACETVRNNADDARGVGVWGGGSRATCIGDVVMATSLVLVLI